MFELECNVRKETSKGELRRLRRDGKIPVVLYSKGNEVVLGSVLKSEIDTVIRSIRPGFLPTTVFALKGLDGKVHTALVREVQYKPTTYEMLHIDFMELDAKRPVIVKVPVEIVNSIDCVGVKMGGLLRQIMRYVKVQAPSNAIPSHLSVDVKELNLNQSQRTKDILFPAGVICLSGQNDVVVTVSK